MGVITEMSNLEKNPEEQNFERAATLICTSLSKQDIGQKSCPLQKIQIQCNK